VSIFNTINQLIKENQLLSAGLGIYGAGVLTFFLRNVPTGIYNFIKRHITTAMTITSQNNIYHNAMIWFEEAFKDKNFRTIKVSNGKYGYSDKTIQSIGYGTHWCFYKKRLIHISLIKDDSNETEYDKDRLVIRKFGRSHKLFKNMIDDFKIVNSDPDKVEIYRISDSENSSWTYVKKQLKRPIDSIFLEQEKKDTILHKLRSFKEDEEWYKKNGIPYQLGILLYGVPGTGKTSLIKAIASYLSYPIYYIDSGNLHKIEKAVSSLPPNCIMVIEDIDTNSVTHSRNSDDRDDGVNELLDLKGIKQVALSSILNSLDGIFSTHGRILITTTNHIEKLDSALIRPGRIDLKVEIGYVNLEIFKQFYDRFFTDSIEIPTDFEIRDNVTAAELQNMLLSGCSIDTIMEKIKK
jgi:mitochondrial chaperone BCS1